MPKAWRGSWRERLAVWFDWRAGRMSDPVVRLRYLRRAMGVTAPATTFGYRMRVPVAALSALAAIVILLPGHNPSSAEARADLDRRMIFPEPPRPDALPEVWLVDRRDGYEAYSNGLRIESLGAAANDPRTSFGADPITLAVRPLGAQPAGIVYHTTESHLAPFEARNNQTLKAVAGNLVSFLRHNRSYHFLIDRFGRVHRIVGEEYAAWHAGPSVWHDASVIYLNLNHSFLGIAFESHTTRSESAFDTATPAQVHAAKVLTAMLRSKYRIAAENCATHAQVSVNPDNFRVGNHTDWAANFPFADIGLPDNYLRPLAAVFALGFSYDETYLGATGARIWRGLAQSDERVRQQATANGLTIADWRRAMRKRYRHLMAPLANNGAPTTIENFRENKP